MKRCSVVWVVGLFFLFLSAAPQLRADGTDKFNYGEHNNTMFADKDNGDHSRSSWADKDNNRDWHWHVGDHDSDGDGSSGSGTGDSDNGTSGSQLGSSSTTNASTPEPPTLVLLLSGFLAAGLGLALKKAA